MRRYMSNQTVFSAIVTLLIMDWVFKPRSSKREYGQYLQSDHWQRVRDSIGEHANWHCEVAGCARHGHNLNAHHLNYKRVGYEQMGDLVYVCPQHHKLIHKNNAFNKRGGGVIPAYGR